MEAVTDFIFLGSKITADGDCSYGIKRRLMDREAWRAAIHGVAKSWTRLSDWADWRSFPGGSQSKESTCNAGDPVSIPGLGRSSGGGHSTLLQYSYLENPMDRGAWWATVHGVTKSRTQLSNFTFYGNVSWFHIWSRLLKSRRSKTVLSTSYINLKISWKCFCLSVWV